MEQESKFHIGIDVGGTNLRAGVVNQRGEILGRAAVPVGEIPSPEALVRRLTQLAWQAMEDAGIPAEQVGSVGIGIPGAVRDGNILYTCNLPLRDVPLETLFRRELDLPVYLGNDADCAAVGEWLYGAGRGLRHFLMITLGTGVGGGLILNGTLYTGCGMAGEVGHMVIRTDGPLCSCGRRGCWEVCCSATGLIRRTREAMEAHPESLLHAVAAETGTVDGRTVFCAAERGDSAALALCREYGADLTAGLTNLVNIFHPEAVALGGGISGAPEHLLLQPVQAAVAAACYARNAGQVPRIVTAQLGGDAGLIGAASLARII